MIIRNIKYTVFRVVAADSMDIPPELPFRDTYLTNRIYHCNSSDGLTRLRVDSLSWSEVLFLGGLSISCALGVHLRAIL